MHLRTMTLQAIGPIAGEHTVDFEAVSASGLFLLDGPTGSGKSTLIDAVVFALYGKVASAEASDDRLRSAYAAEDVESFVDLTFEVGSGTYRVRRTPAYDRPKKRGAGTVKQQASVRMWRVQPDDPTGAIPGSEPITRLDEAGLEIERVVGLSRTQFVQTIVLPQGEFARFLRANPEDRRGLLQKIFGTEVYERMQQRLAEMRAEANREIEAARSALGTAAAHLIGAARLGEDDALAVRASVEAAGASAGIDEVTALVGAHAVALGAAAEGAVTTAAAAELARAGAGVALDDAVRTERLIARRTRLLADQAALDAALSQHAEAVLVLERARAAAAVRPLLEGADRALADVATARKTVVAALDAAPPALAAVVTGGSDGTDHPGDVDPAVLGPLRDVREDAVRDAAALTRVVSLEAELNDKRRAVRDARDLVETLRDEIAADDRWLAARPALSATLAEQSAAAEALAARVPEHSATLAALESSASAHLALAASRSELAAAAEGQGAAATAAAATVAHEAALRTARIAGLAGELATALRDGESCPVCGSGDHPAKASLAPDHVSAADVAAAERQRSAAEEALGQARDLHGRLAERVAVAQDALSGSTPEQVAADLASTRDLLMAARAAAADAERLTAECVAHDEATAARRAARQETVTRQADVTGRVEVLQQALGADEAEVALASTGFPTVVARQSVLLALVEAATELLAAITDRQDAERHAADRRAELEGALAERDFADAAAARAALLGRSDLAELERGVTAYTAAVERVRADLAEDEINALAPDAAVDLPAAREAERVAREAATAAEGHARVAVERAAAAQDAADDVLEAARRLASAWAAGGPVTRLAGLASGTGGDNGKGLSLATYVLARRFEDVVAAANERLLAMSDGRYELTRSEQKEDVSSRRTGLSMRVVDHRTQQQRDPRTLSGGESFYVSLCLALGMADVVTAEAGGIDLGTLFVDEGFGTLDAHTLDQVLLELGKLRAGGRVVGVVSHVDALKQSIADRIEVRPLPEGPSTLRVLAS
ncbi:AAA family ATPase [Cellulomonas sp. PhB150]|uniref:AAA family ATPase n=1 Tax=Cellulomonas sp. PhB150 TaxID=2485188 RepID=UPI000F47A1D5|nr:SMC family ATPase [Cellulomonas sp. PhB150]ROS26139.1 exonuclease SbcC [Cellulomonas sp. PhB150]